MPTGAVRHTGSLHLRPAQSPCRLRSACLPLAGAHNAALDGPRLHKLRPTLPPRPPVIYHTSTDESAAAEARAAVPEEARPHYSHAVLFAVQCGELDS